MTASASTLHWVPKTRPFRLGLAEPDEDEELPPGAVVGGRFRIVRPLGAGGMGRVYEVEHVQLPRRLALKLLRRDKHSTEHLARFRQEAESASRVGHPAIVDVVDFGVGEDGRVYLAMELLRGQSLEDWLGAPGRLVDGLRWLAEIARGLHAAHATGVVHRDIKPQNLFLHRGSDGRVVPKILDFGIAKVTTTDHTAIATAVGAVLGTPYYLAPERALGRPLDARADLYSFGVVLYEMLTGNVPFFDDTFMGVVMKHVRELPLDPRQAAPERPIPDGVASLAMALLAKDPAARPASGQEVAERIEAMVERDFAALAAVATGPRGPIAATEESTMSLDAIATRPTTAPTDDAPIAAAVSAPVVVPEGGADRVHSAAAVRTRFETSSPSLSAASIPVEPDRASSSPARAIAIAIVVVAAAGVAGVLAMKPRPPAQPDPPTEPTAPAAAPTAVAGELPEPQPRASAPVAAPAAAVGTPAPTPATTGPAPTVVAPTASTPPAASKPSRPKRPATKSPTASKPKDAGLPAFKEGDAYDD